MLLMVLVLCISGSCSVAKQSESLCQPNLYDLKLFGLLQKMKEVHPMEDRLMCTSLEIQFEQDGTITVISGYLYGYDQDNQLKSGYQVSYHAAKSDQLSIAYQNWAGDTATPYDPENDFHRLCWMVDQVNIQQAVSSMQQNEQQVQYVLSSYGIRDLGSDATGLYAVNADGSVVPYPVEEAPYRGQSFSVYDQLEQRVNRYMYRGW